MDNGTDRRAIQAAIARIQVSLNYLCLNLFSLKYIITMYVTFNNDVIYLHELQTHLSIHYDYLHNEYLLFTVN